MPATRKHGGVGGRTTGAGKQGARKWRHTVHATPDGAGLLPTESGMGGSSSNEIQTKGGGGVTFGAAQPPRGTQWPPSVSYGSHWPQVPAIYMPVPLAYIVVSYAHRALLED